jgi:hypothetical protein
MNRIDGLNQKTAPFPRA